MFRALLCFDQPFDNVMRPWWALALGAVSMTVPALVAFKYFVAAWKLPHGDRARMPPESLVQ